MGAPPQTLFHPGECPILEDQAAYRSQFVDGEIFAMAGAQPEHIEITDNITAALRTLLRGRPCRSYSNDMRVRTDAGGL